MQATRSSNGRTAAARTRYDTEHFLKSTRGRYLIALNGEIVPENRRPDTTLHENDELSIMPPLKGG